MTKEITKCDCSWTVHEPYHTEKCTLVERGLAVATVLRPIDETREVVVHGAFPLVRKDGFFARVNHLCCGNCGHHDLHGRLEEWNKTHKKQKKGYVFWHSQTEEAFKPTGWRGNMAEGFHIYHGCIHEDGCTCAARNLVDALKKMGIPYQWNGESNEAVYVKMYNQVAVRSRAGKRAGKRAERTKG